MKFLLTIVALLASSVISFIPVQSVLSQPATETGCDVLPSQARLIMKINLETEGTYRLWIRQVTPATGNQLYVDIDDRCTLSVAKNQQSDKLSWSGSDAQGQPLLFALDKGEHAIALAGDQTGIAVDMGLLMSDHDCIPQDTGSNCITQGEAAGEVVAVEEPTPISEVVQSSKLSLALKTTAIVALTGIVAALLWHYAYYAKRILHASIGAKSHWRRKLRHIFSISTLRHFVNHHRFVLIMYGAAAGIFMVMLFVGIVAAQDNRVLPFEAESGEVYGAATKVTDAQVSGGWYVLFGGSAPVITGSDPTPETPATPSTGGSDGTQNGGSGGGSGGGGGDSGGGGTTPVGECPAYPAFPDENCTGWEHTGVTLTDCTGQTDGGYIWDGQQTTFDSCYFSVPLTVQAANVTITRSQVHGHISTHWTNDYDYRNLTLRDVEVEEENNNDAFLAAMGGHNYSCTRCNVHHTGSGIHFGNNTTIRDSYTHDLNYTDGAHGTGIGAGQGHGSNSLIIHNNSQCNRLVGQPGICSSAMSIYPEDDGQGGTVHDVRVEKNLFNTTGSYCLYAGGLPATNIDFIDNYFGKKFYSTCGFYGPVTAYQPEGGQWVNNVWADGSGPVIP